MNKTKGQSGITLVALVVTIVVLLILAGITIALVFSQDGVIGKAQDAAEQSNAGTVADTIQDAVVAKQIDALAGNLSTPATITGEIAGTGVTITSGTLTVGTNSTVTCTDVVATFKRSESNTETYNITYSNGTFRAALQTSGSAVENNEI